MKNYITDKNNIVNEVKEKSFVLNYTIEGDKIIVNLANGGNFTLPNNEGNKEVILDKMEEQVREAGLSLEFDVKTKAILDSMLLVANSTMCLSYAFSSSISEMACKLFLTLFALGGVSSISALKMRSELLKDFKKNMLFLANEEYLKLASNAYGKSILLHTKPETKELVESPEGDKPVFDLNNVDKMEYRELKKILKNINRIGQHIKDTNI